MTSRSSTGSQPHSEPVPAANLSPRPQTRTDRGRQTGFLRANGVEFSLLFLAIGLAVIGALVVAGLSSVERPVVPIEDAAPETVSEPEIPLPEGDIGGVGNSGLDSEADAVQ